MRYATSLSIIVVFLAAFATLATPSFGQQSDCVKEWSKKFEDIRTRMKQVAEAINQKAEDFRGTGKDPGEFFEEIQELSKENQKLYGEIQAIYKEIRESRDKLATEEYKLAREEYKGAMDEYKGAMNEYKGAMNEYSRTMRKDSEAIRRNSEAMRKDGGAKTAREDAKKQLASELEELSKDLDFKKGAEVLALRDSKLMSGEETVGNVRKGEKLTVDRVEGDWLYVRNGWIYSRHVISAPLMAWYQRLPEKRSVQDAGQVRVKLEGVLFNVVDSGAGPALTAGGTVRVGGVVWPKGTFAGYERVNIFLQDRSGGQIVFSLKFPGNFPMRANDPTLARAFGKSYGAVMKGDYVLIDTKSRQVFVNSERRRPR